MPDYYEDLYDGYSGLQYVDVSPYLDMSTPTNQNIVIDQKNLVRFRWWTKELNNGYIPAEHKPYRIIITDITEAKEELQVNFRFIDDYRAAFPPFILCDPYFTYSCYLRSPGKDGKPYLIRKISNNSEEGRWQTQGFFPSVEMTDEEILKEAMNFGE